MPYARNVISNHQSRDLRVSHEPTVASNDGHLVDSEVIRCNEVWKVYPSRSENRSKRAITSAATLLEKIQAEGLGKYEVFKRLNCIVAVAGVSFCVRAGETFCIMGLSGSGKSTLVRHLNRLIEPTSGSIFINGDDINQKSPQALRALRAQKIGMVFQDMALWPHRTVRGNVSYGLEVQRIPKDRRKKIVEDTLRLVQLNGWEDRDVSELSGGMRQRVGLARALALDPEMLLLDEPFSALDPLIRADLQIQFKEIVSRMKKTAVFITHDLDEAFRLGDRVAIMKDGAFVQVGTPEEIMTRPEGQYVADFVKRMPRLNIVRAYSIMEPLKAGESIGRDDLRDHPVMGESATLAELADVAISSDKPIMIEDTDHRIVGTLNRRSILCAIRGPKS